MSPANSDTPLRRSEVTRTNVHVAINDDEAERREERRRSVLHAASMNINDTTTIEDNETLKQCLELCNGNKLSRENAWSLSLIDTLSTLLDAHHKALNNFKMAGSSLEASSKVYGLRVDSIHVDVLRMAAGLNSKKFSEKNLNFDIDGVDNNDDDGVATGGEGGADPNASAAGVDGNAHKSPGKKKKKTRKAVCTVTKNKDTLNARLDTVPLQDPVFGKLNSTVGSINSSNRLLNNILLTTNSELRLRTNFPVFDAIALPEMKDYTAEVPTSMFESNETTYKMVPCDKILRLATRCDQLLVRPLHSGYVITDTPVILPDEPDVNIPAYDNDDHGHFGTSEADDFTEQHHSMAFDINAECEPVPESHEFAAIVDVDYGDFDDLTTAERSAINRCRGIQRQPVLIEDLRPVDSSSQLEYSYRPMEKISRFWAGPAHWKFKKSRASSLAHLGLANSENNGSEGGGRVTGGPRRTHAHAAALLAKKRQKQLDFSQVHDDLFIKWDDNFKGRRVNIHKKWDNRKLKLPTDFQVNPRMFFEYQFAPGLRVTIETTSDMIHETQGGSDFDDVDDRLTSHNVDDHHDMSAQAMSNGMDFDGNLSTGDNMHMDCDNMQESADNDMAESTVLEIPNEFANAPTMVQKIVVPFAKRAKVIDMKSLKKSCSHLISKQLSCTVDENSIPQDKNQYNETYSQGVASFHETYAHLPELLSQKMAESLSPAIALYSVLHLANDLGLRLIQQDDLEDFKIRKINK